MRHRRRFLPAVAFLAAAGSMAGCAASPSPVDAAAALDHAWRDNLDDDWFVANVPLLDTPEEAIDAAYLYRWEVLTKHLVYGSPEVGYTFTEFIDRPFWSGAYGGISCPLGHQMYEVRWLKDRRIVEDFARYWLTAPGAEPRSYSNWYGDAVWATYRVLGDRDWAVSMLPLMERQIDGWVRERWDEPHGMFVWDGMHDGMETNINSRQTPAWFDGAPGYRPTLNSYLWADMQAVARVAVLAGDAAKADSYAERAARLKARIQQQLWDPERRFFFQQFARDEETVADAWPGAGSGGADGSTPPIAAGSLTYESGPWAGDPHGRELIGVVPWQFGLPDPGYEMAWEYVLDPQRFATPFGPATTEIGDPLFYVSPRCCVWSGNSWPYATAQTLTAMAVLLNDYEQDVVTVDDYVAALRTYTATQQRGGRPYVAEAADPFTGAWDGHNKEFHSEHYLHSSYVDLVISGLIGLRPQDDDALVVNPLVPAAWDWFALQDVRYRGHDVTVLWDRDGSRYGRGVGLQIIVDGVVAARADGMGRLSVELDRRPSLPTPRPSNWAVNNERAWYPHASASSWRPEAPPEWAVDGQFWYHASPPNRWLAAGGPESDWFEIDFGSPRRIDTVKLYFPDDTVGPPDVGADPPEGDLLDRRDGDERARARLPVRVPLRYRLESFDGTAWTEIGGQSRSPAVPAGRRANVVSFPPFGVQRLRVLLEHRPGAVSGLAEIEAWGDGGANTAGTVPPANLALGRLAGGRATVTASYVPDGVDLDVVVDGRTAFNHYTDQVWRATGTPHAADWIEVDLGAEELVGRVQVSLWAWPGRGTNSPRSMRVEAWDAAGGAWAAVGGAAASPSLPLGMARNEVFFEPAVTRKVRVVLEHALPEVSGVSEIIVLPPDDGGKGERR